MKNALDRIDKLIKITLKPINFPASNIAEKEILKLQSFAEEEYWQICDHLKEEFFSAADERQFELYVQRYQATIIHLADTLVVYIAGVGSNEIRELYQAVLNILEKLLSFIETYFSRYFNVNAKIPDNYKIISRKELNAGITVFKKAARKYSVNETLLQVILDSYQEHTIEHSVKPITYHRLIYQKKLLNELLKVINNKSLANKEEEIINVLKYFNFNNVRFLAILTTRIAAEINEQPAVHDKLQHLYWHLKSSSQLHTKPQFVLHQHTPDLRDLCISWLQEEIYFFEKTNPPVQSMPPPAIKETSPIEIGLSVPQFAFMLKLLVDKGIIKNQSYRNLTQVAAQNFKTAQSENISAESLRIKSHTPDRSTVQKVKDVLIDIINHINTNFKIHGSVILLNYALQEIVQTIPGAV